MVTSLPGLRISALPIGVEVFFLGHGPFLGIEHLMLKKKSLDRPGGSPI